jgi:hypothetical protein
MSGRLVILPKKSYCPWKPENVARVEDDERRHAELQKRLQAKEQSRQGHERIKHLRNNANHDYKRNVDDVSQHVNLFRIEEEEAAARLRQSAKSFDRHSQSRIFTATNERPFYIDQPVTSVSNNNGDNGCNYEESQKVRKAALDPAMAFMDVTQSQTRSTTHQSRSNACHSESDSTRHQSHSSSSKHKRRKGHESYSREKDAFKRMKTDRQQSSESKQRASDTTLADLRRRRQEREATERSRQERIIMDHAGSANWKNHRRYNDQFHPNLAK